jgi:hypothetical protein
MNNTSSFIMRDQVHDLIPSIMEHRSEHPSLRFLSQLSVIAITLVTFNLLLF